MANPIRVTVWNEFRHEKHAGGKPAEVYPRGIHTAIAECLGEQPDIVTRTATLDEPGHGLSDEVLAATDVLTWWGHMAHHEVSDEIVEKVVSRVWSGMGFIALHSGHFSKPFKRLMGTSCDLKWREIGERERVWAIDPAHPITQGIPEHFEIDPTEMYGERFDIPQPDQQVFISWYQGGEVFRSGCCWHRGRGKVFYFSPGHETCPTYYDENVRRVITNAVRWAAPLDTTVHVYGNAQPLENMG